MNADTFQAAVLRTAQNADVPGWTMINAALGVAGESGEYADLIKKYVFHGHELDLDKCKKELGDILYYVAWAAAEHGFDLSDVMQTNIEKLLTRYPNGFNTADSIKRQDVK